MAFLDTGRRFRQIRKLGEGGMGVVYEVHDEVRDMRVALKTLRHVSPEHVFRMKREFRALCELSHPNIINLYELSSNGDDWFMTMELVDGVDILSYSRHGRIRDEQHTTERLDTDQPDTSSTTSITRVSGILHSGDESVSLSASIGLPTPPLVPTPVAQFVDLGRLKQVIAQLAQALHMLHQADMVHRDLKPSNVFVTRRGRVVLMDFGIVAELSRLSDADAGTMGTPHYMAPEQAKGAIPHASADWYAFGVILYEALTERLPFTGRPTQVIQIKQKRSPLPPSVFASGIPPYLEELCVTLLAIDEAQRPTGVEVLRELGIRSRRQRRRSTLPGSIAPLFVGRREELATLTAHLDEVDAGATRWTMVSGPTGMGKTALVEHFVRERVPLVCPGTLVLAGSCREREHTLYKAFESVMEQLSSQLLRFPEATYKALLPADFPLAAELFAPLRRVCEGWERIVQACADGPMARRTRATQALRSLLANLTRSGPILLRIDDLHWADPDSLALLCELMARPAPARVLLLTTAPSDWDPTDASTLSEAATCIPRLSHELPYARIELRPLSLTEQRAWVDELLTLDAFRDAAPVSRTVLHDQHIGHPMLILELVRSVTSLGLQFGDKSTPGLNDLVRLRVAALGDRPAQALIELIAVAGQPLPSPVFARAAGITEKECQHALSVLRVNLLIRFHRHTPHPWPTVYHEVIGHAIVERLSDDKRSAMHRALAEVLAEWPEAPAECLAESWLGAGEKVLAAQAFLRAGREALAAQAIEQANRHFKAVLELTPDAASDAEHDAQHALLACRACIGLIEVSGIRGRDDDRVALLERARDLALARDFHEELATIHYHWGLQLFWRGDGAGCLSHQEAACHHARSAGSSYLEAQALGGLGSAYYLRGQMTTACDSFGRCVSLARHHGFDDITVVNLAMRGLTLMYQNDLGNALQDSLNAVAGAQRAGHKRAELVARCGALPWILYEMAAFEQALDECERALALAEDSDTHRFDAHIRAMSARILVHLGHHDRARAMTRAAMNGYRPRAQMFAAAMIHSTMAMCTDDADERAQHLAEGWSILEDRQYSHDHLWFHRDAIDLAIRLRDPGTLERHAQGLADYTRAEPMPWSDFHVARARALAAHMRGQGSRSQLQALHEQARLAGLETAARTFEWAIAEAPE